MNIPHTCPQCHQPLPEDAPEGLCPPCLMRELADATNVLPPGSTPPRDGVDIADIAEVAKRLPQFEVIELSGRGGMGVVYKARQAQLDRVVALKILPPEDSHSPDFIERFRREARSLAKLSHPNIVSVYDFGEGGGLYFIVMEFVEGANLRQLLLSQKLTADEALAIVPKICDALQYAHEEGIMHRDIKPENILVDKKGRVKIADFGLAKLLHRDPSEALLTMSGMTVGTPRYMAPEQMDKPETVDHRADIYSLGVVFYEMLTGELPMGRFAPPSQKVQVDVRLDEIVLHAMERDVERRYQHVSEIRTDVQKVTSTPQVAPGSALMKDAKATSLTPLPRFYWLRVCGLLPLGWAVVGALWYQGLTGFVSGSVVMAAITYELLLCHARRNPCWVENWQAAGTWKRFNLVGMIIPLLMSFMMLIGGMHLTLNSARLQADPAVPSREAFEARYKGKEHQLIRRLDAFKEQVPAVELSVESYSGGSPRAGEGTLMLGFAWIWIGGGSLYLLFCCQQTMKVQTVSFSNISLGRSSEAMKDATKAGAAVSVGKILRGGWRPALVCGGTVLASAACAFLVLAVMLRPLGLSGRTYASVNKTVTVHATVTQAASALDRWAADNGYTSGSRCRWSLETVPKGNLVARVEVSDVWKASSSDQWPVTFSRPERPLPDVAFQIVGSEKPVQSEVGINCLGFVEIGSEKQKRWQGIVKSLADAVAKAAEIDPSKPVETHAVKDAAAGTEMGFDWLGLGAVLAATLLWIFARAHSFTTASVPEARPGPPANEIKPGANAAAGQQKPRITLLMVACATGVAGCLWPYSVVEGRFLGNEQQNEISTQPGVATLGIVGFDESLPAAKAGVVLGDTILSMGGRQAHIAGLDGLDRIWKETPVGTNVEITLLRNNKPLVLHTVRPADPVVVCFYANWQFMAGFCFLLFAVVVLLSQPFGRATRWRGMVATLLGLVLVCLLSVGGSFLDQPAKELWNVIHHAYDYSPATLGQKLAAGLAATALLLLGVFDIRRGFNRKALSSETL